MLGIKALIAEKRAKIKLLETHIEQLQSMAAEEVGMILRRERRGGENRRPENPNTRIARVFAFLAENPGPQSVRAIGAAIGVPAANLSGGISNAIAEGKLVRVGRGVVRLTKGIATKLVSKTKTKTESKPKTKSKTKTKATKTAGHSNGNGSRAGAILSYLKAHPGPHESGKVRAALGLGSSEFWGSISSYLTRGKVVRPGKGLIAFGGEAEQSP